MNNYLPSSCISVFPCANRSGQYKDGTTVKTDYNLQSRLTSEYNLTNIINQLVGRPAFVIRPNGSDTTLWDGSGNGESLSFNINGYYFNIEKFVDIHTAVFGSLEKDTKTETRLFASIKVSSKEVNGYGILKELASCYEDSTTLDDDAVNGNDSNFLGIKFTTSVEGLSSTDTNIWYSLLIAERTSGTQNWKVPANSLIRYTSDILELPKYGTVGSNKSPVYFANGLPVAISGNIGNTNKPVYIKDGEFTAISGNIGNTNKPVYISGGAIKECGPIKIDDGTLN